jgi:hypothetical protein
MGLVVVAVIGFQQRAHVRLLRHSHVERAAKALRTLKHLRRKQALPPHLQHLPLEPRHRAVDLKPECRRLRVDAAIDFPQR